MQIVCCISILSWFIAAQGLQTDPDCNDYLTSKWLGLIPPLVAGFDRPLTVATADEPEADQTMIDPTKTGWNLAQPLRSKDTFDNHKQLWGSAGTPSPRMSRPLASSLRVIEAMSSCNVLLVIIEISPIKAG